MSEQKEILVFIVRKDTKCDECGVELWKGSFIKLEKKGALCLSCADLDHLDFLTAGDPALTRRSSKHSKITAKVLKWSRTRNQYERQGILVEPAAIDKAEQECLSDQEVRERQCERGAERRAEEDQTYINQFSEAIHRFYPNCPKETASRIARHACLKYSERVGRSAAAKEFDPEAIKLAVIAHIRHERTNYDELMGIGAERSDAREAVRGAVDQILWEWKR